MNSQITTDKERAVRGRNAFGKRNTSESAPILLVKGIAGLGNRMLALLTAALYSQLSGRGLYVDWTDAVFAPNGDQATKHINLFPLLFDSPEITAWDPELGLGDTAISPTQWQGRLSLSAADLSIEIDPEHFRDFGMYHRTSIDVSRLDHPADLAVIWSWRERILPLRKHLRNRNSLLYRKSDTEVLRALAHRYLRPSQAIAAMVNERWSTLPQGAVVGLHVRHTDMKAPVEPLSRRVKAALDKYDSASILLATDNADVQHRIEKQFGKERVYYANKSFPDAGIPLHYDLGCSDRLKRASEALVDMFLLSRCDHLVYASRSSFGYVSHVLCERQQVVSDSDRFNPSVQAKRVLQKYWYR